MKCCKEWSFIGQDKCFPRLKKLRVDGCPNIAGSLPKQLTIVNGCDSMKSLPLNNFPRLEELDLEGCQSLKFLTFTKETGTALRSTAIDGCKNLRLLPEHMHKLLPSVADMKMVNCPEIMSFPEGGLPSNLNELSIGNCSKLIAQNKHWDLQGLASPRLLCVRYYEHIRLDSFPEGLRPSSLTSFTLGNLRHLTILNDNAFQKVACLN